MTYLNTMENNWMEATSKEDLVKRAIEKLGKVHFSVSSGIFDPQYCTFPVSFVELVEICNQNGYVLDFSTHTVRR